MKRVVLFALSLLLLAACGSKVDGTYSFEAEGEQISYKFEPGGKVYWSIKERGGQVEGGEFKYEVNGDKVKIIGPQGQVNFLTLREDGSLELEAPPPVGILVLKKTK